MSETETVLHNAINGLPGKERRICELSFFEGMKNIDIAKMLNVSDSTVKKQKASALALLRKKLESYSG